MSRQHDEETTESGFRRAFLRNMRLCGCVSCSLKLVYKLGTLFLQPYEQIKSLVFYSSPMATCSELAANLRCYLLVILALSCAHF